MRINGLNRDPKLARQHHSLTSRTAARVNNDFKPVLRQRSQDIKSKVVVSGAQLVYVCEKEVKRVGSFHPARTNYFASVLAARICGSRMSRT
jgi:hypothetical protein